MGDYEKKNLILTGSTEQLSAPSLEAEIRSARFLLSSFKGKISETDLRSLEECSSFYDQNTNDVVTNYRLTRR